VLSPSTTAHDFKTKLPDHQRMPSVRKILLVSSDERRIERWRARAMAGATTPSPARPLHPSSA
jgi:hypothetical protein